MVLEAEAGYGQPPEGVFEVISVDQAHYSIAMAGCNYRFLIRNRFTRAQVTWTRWVFLASPR